MAERDSLFQTLQKIAELPPWEKVPADESAAEAGMTARKFFCQEILKAILILIESLDTEEENRAVLPGNGLPEFGPGYLAGQVMAREPQGANLGLQVFFEAHKIVRDFLLAELSRLGVDNGRQQKWLVILAGGLGELAAGFAMGRMLVVKTTSRRRQQEAKRHILQEKKRYAAIFYQMEEPSFVVDSGMRLVDINPAGEKFFGKSSVELIGSRCSEVIGQVFCGECPLKETIDQGGSFSNFEITFPARPSDGEGEEEEGEPRTLLLAGASLGLDSDEGSNRGGIVIIQDITERKNIELELDEYRDWLEDFVDERTEELVEANARLQTEIRERCEVERELIQTSADLQRSNADLEQFAQVASHDLREPLMLVASFAERMVKGYASMLDERGMDYLDRIVRSTRKLQELVDALLQLSKVSTSAGQFEPLNMNELVRDVLSVFAEQIDQLAAEVEVASLHDLDGDAVQMRQLFQNIISNALKYHRDGITPSIVISSRILGDVCEISVEDNGIGLPGEDIEKIFEPFVRLHGQDVYDGAGMGLTTCQKIVSRHGGEIIARSKPDDGAVFVIRLPLHH